MLISLGVAAFWLPLCDFPSRSDGLNLSADKSWFMSGAYVDDVPLRDPGLSDKVAETYWARFLMLVEFVDQEVNNGVQLTNTWDYLDCRYLRRWRLNLDSKIREKGR